jgi:hypothetical protein
MRINLGKFCLGIDEIQANPIKNESESFIRLAPSFTFVSQKFVFIERIHCVYIKFENIIAKHIPVSPFIQIDERN